MKAGDLVRWPERWDSPGLVLETKPAEPDSPVNIGGCGQLGPGTAVLALLPGLPEPEWFHERELEVINESR